MINNNAKLIIVGGVQLPVATYPYTTAYRRVAGQAEGMSVAGTEIIDTLSEKYDLTVSLLPMTKSELMGLAPILHGVQTVVYDNPYLGSITVRMRPDPSAVDLALKSASKEVYSGLLVTFREV